MERPRKVEHNFEDIFLAAVGLFGGLCHEILCGSKQNLSIVF